MARDTQSVVRRRVHERIRKRVEGSEARPRLCVFRSNKHIYAQVVDDSRSLTIASASSRDPEALQEVSNGGNVKAAKVVGKIVARRAKEKGIESVVFDRGGYVYHGRVKALADAAREGGLKF